MTLKRKRSTTAASTPTSSSSDSSEAQASTSSIPFFYNQSKPIREIAKPFMYESEGADTNKRTQKRYRNNRPNDEVVHGDFYYSTASFLPTKLTRTLATTLNRLFAAQKQPQDMTVPMPFSPEHSPPLEILSAPTQRTTLHSFWNIPRALPEESAVATQQSYFPETKLPGLLDEDESMDLDTASTTVAELPVTHWFHRLER